MIFVRRRAPRRSRPPWICRNSIPSSVSSSGARASGATSEATTFDDGEIKSYRLTVTAPYGTTSPNQSSWTTVADRLNDALQGEYIIERELGRGGMAAVFLAYEPALDRRVAIKVMSPGLMPDASMVQRFQQEAVTVARLNHPNIITIHAVRQVGDLHCFVMKFVVGRALADILGARGALPIPVVRHVLCEVGSALSY